MKNLIEEIEKEMIDYGYEKEASFNAGLGVAINILNQYNIITVPKQIKLSEILSRLEETYVEEIVVKDNGFCGYVISIKKFTGEDSSKFYMNDFIVEIDDNEIFEVYAPLEDNTKWLYTLWIAGTEIVDDLAGDE